MQNSNLSSSNNEYYFPPSQNTLFSVKVYQISNRWYSRWCYWLSIGIVPYAQYFWRLTILNHNLDTFGVKIWRWSLFDAPFNPLSVELFSKFINMSKFSVNSSTLRWHGKWKSSFMEGRGTFCSKTWLVAREKLHECLSASAVFQGEIERISRATRHVLFQSRICFLYEQQHREKFW